MSIEVELPLEFVLERNYPNPFNLSTTISYSIPENELIKLAAYNLLVEEVATVVKSFQKADSYEVIFDVGELSNRIYVYKIEASNFS